MFANALPNALPARLEEIFEKPCAHATVQIAVLHALHEAVISGSTIEDTKQSGSIDVVNPLASIMCVTDLAVTGPVIPLCMSMMPIKSYGLIQAFPRMVTEPLYIILTLSLSALSATHVEIQLGELGSLLNWKRLKLPWIFVE